jgi:hypothetical protein
MIIERFDKKYFITILYILLASNYLLDEPSLVSTLKRNYRKFSRLRILRIKKRYLEPTLHKILTQLPIHYVL